MDDKELREIERTLDFLREQVDTAKGVARLARGKNPAVIADLVRRINNLDSLTRVFAADVNALIAAQEAGA